MRWDKKQRMQNKSVIHFTIANCAYKFNFTEKIISSYEGNQLKNYINIKQIKSANQLAWHGMAC